MVDISKLTPAQRQFYELKKNYKDCILLFRMGDFYETFYEDAKISSKVLDIALTCRDKNSANPVPMAGVPYHSADKYINKLVSSGYKVAIAEQIGEVKPGQIVKRDVVSVVTPGTFFDDKNERDFNFICSIIYGGLNEELFNICWGDFSIGHYFTKSFSDFDEMLKFIYKLDISEFVIDIDFPSKDDLEKQIKSFTSSFVSVYDLPYDINDFLTSNLGVQNTTSYGQALDGHRRNALALLLNYLKDTQKSEIKNINKISFHGKGDSVLLDDITLKNLEIFKSSYEGTRKYSLIDVLDNTNSSLGGRKLNSLLMNPINNLHILEQRLDGIDYFFCEKDIRENILKLMNSVEDFPRLITKLMYKKLSPFTFNRIKISLRQLFGGVDFFNEQFISLLLKFGLSDVCLNNIKDYYIKLEGLLKDEGFSEEMDFVQDGYSTEIDELRKLAYHSDELLINYQKDIYDRVKLNSLKVRYINNQGYFIEVSKKDVDQFEKHFQRGDEKFDFIRRQTLKSAERYVSPYLDEIQGKIISSKEKLQKLEKTILESLKNEIENLSSQFSEFSDIIGDIDVYSSIAEISMLNDWIRPSFNKKGVIQIISGKHPVIEKYLGVGESFIPNNLEMCNQSSLHIITGPNMGGKSTFLRQNALIVLMSHCGLFVPCQKADMYLVDGIFARVGSGDIIAKNQSTFMTEMIEVANILHNSTDRSFIVLDELGRGTSTYDGVSLAKAIVQYISTRIKAKTLFATHYHELIKLEKNYKNIENYSVSVYETDKNIVFLKKIVKGGADKSYGVDVAKIAGLPIEIIELSKSYLKEFESSYSKPKDIPLFDFEDIVKSNSVGDTKYSKIKDYIESYDINSLTPLESLNILNEIKKIVKD